MEKDQKAAEEARKLAEQQAAQESTKVDNLSKSTVVQQSSPVKTEQVKKVETVKIDTLSTEAEKKAKQAKLDTTKKVESIKTVEPVKTTENEMVVRSLVCSVVLLRTEPRLKVYREDWQ